MNSQLQSAKATESELRVAHRSLVSEYESAQVNLDSALDELKSFKEANDKYIE